MNAYRKYKYKRINEYENENIFAHHFWHLFLFPNTRKPGKKYIQNPKNSYIKMHFDAVYLRMQKTF